MYSLHRLKTGSPQCTKKTPFTCTQRYKIRKRGRGWGRGGASHLSCRCSHRASLTSCWPRIVNHTCHIRRGSGLFGNYVWNGEMKIKLHMSANFQIVICNLLTLTPTSRCCWRDACQSSGYAGWAAGNQGVTPSPQRYVFWNIKLWWKPLQQSCSVACGQRECRLLLEVLPDMTL